MGSIGHSRTNLRADLIANGAKFDGNRKFDQLRDILVQFTWTSK